MTAQYPLRCRCNLDRQMAWLSRRQLQVKNSLGDLGPFPYSQHNPKKLARLCGTHCLSFTWLGLLSPSQAKVMAESCHVPTFCLHQDINVIPLSAVIPDNVIHGRGKTSLQVVLFCLYFVFLECLFRSETSQKCCFRFSVCLKWFQIWPGEFCPTALLFFLAYSWQSGVPGRKNKQGRNFW